GGRSGGFWGWLKIFERPAVPTRSTHTFYPAITDEWQGNAFGRNHSQNPREVDERLPQHHGRDAQGEQTAKHVRRGESGANAAPSVNDKQRDHQYRADKAEFLANHRVDEVRVR